MLAGATAVELLHWATLVHDDVIDGARSRHGQPTVNAREGVGQAIVTGDLLIGAAFELGCRVGTDTVRCLAQTLADLCVGQTREDSHRFDPGVDEDDVLAVASGKTGSLLAAAARIGGHCAAVDAPVLDALSEFGMAFGISLQLLDDVLDLVSSVELLGKPVGIRLRQRDDDPARGGVPALAVRNCRTWCDRACPPTTPIAPWNCCATRRPCGTPCARPATTPNGPAPSSPRWPIRVSTHWPAGRSPTSTTSSRPRSCRRGDRCSKGPGSAGGSRSDGVGTSPVLAQRS